MPTRPDVDIMRTFWRTLLRVIFPKRCGGCRRTGSYLCAQCAGALPSPEPIAPGWIISVWSYKHPTIKRLLWKFKFEGTFAIAEDLCRYAADHLIAELADKALFENVGKLTLVPIPLSQKSKRARGYNQSEILARALAEQLGPEYCVRTALTKIRETSAQHSIQGRSNRLRNIRGSYQADASVADETVLIIDDITTTHATLIEARRALRAAGAQRVFAFTIAH